MTQQAAQRPTATVIGFAAHGLFRPLVIGALVLAIDLAYAVMRWGRGGGRHRITR